MASSLSNSGYGRWLGPDARASEYDPHSVIIARNESGSVRLGELLEFLRGAGVFCAVFVLLIAVITSTRARRMPIQRPVRTVIARDEVPAKERALFDTIQSRLEALGFVSAGAFRTLKAVALKEGEISYTDAYVHPVEGVLASVDLPEVPDYGESVMVSFETHYLDGTKAFTTSRLKHFMLPAPAGWTTHDDFLPDPESTFHAHVARQRATGKAFERDTTTLLKASSEDLPRLFEHWIAARVAVPSPKPDRWRLSWRASTRLALVAMAGMGRAARAAPKSSVPVDGSHALEQQFAATKALEWSSDDKQWLTWISVGAFAALGVWLWDWTFMLILLAVIGFHEMGHYAAMRLVGYRNLHVFFVPGLGGAATGRKADATPLQKTFVYLAGPVPGLLVVVIASIAFGTRGPEASSWIAQLMLAAFLINYLNLLPVTPLDGGRIAEALLFTRWPLLRFLFAAACALVLLGFGIWLKDWVLGGIGSFVILSLSHQWRVYRIEAALPPREEALPESEAKAVVFATASRPEFARWSAANRGTAALSLVDELQGRKPRWRDTLAGLAIYAVCLAAPLVVMGVYAEKGAARWLVGEDKSQSANRGPDRDWRAEVAAARTKPPLVRLELLLAAIDAGYEDPRDQFALEAEAWEIGKTLPEGDQRRYRSLVALLHDDASPALQRRRLQEAEGELTRAQGKDRLYLAEFLRIQARVGPLPVSLEANRKSLQIREELLAATHYEVLRTRTLLAHDVYRSGDVKEAGKLLERTLADAQALDDRRRWDIENAYAGYLVDEARAAEAEARLPAVIARMRSVKAVLWLQERALDRLLWTQMAQSNQAAFERARATLAEIESGVMPNGKTRVFTLNPEHQLDRLAVARALGDEQLAAEATQNLRAVYPNGPPERMCIAHAPSTVANDWWERVPASTHLRILIDLGMCKG